MEKSKPRLLVFGAGVIGSIYAARLAKRGADVTLLARGQRLADIREHGIRRNVKGKVTSILVRRIATPQPIIRDSMLAEHTKFAMPEIFALDEAFSALTGTR
jgi:ketopantoate reductase